MRLRALLRDIIFCWVHKRSGNCVCAVRLVVPVYCFKVSIIVITVCRLSWRWCQGKDVVQAVVYMRWSHVFLKEGLCCPFAAINKKSPSTCVLNLTKEKKKDCQWIRQKNTNTHTRTHIRARTHTLSFPRGIVCIAGLNITIFLEVIMLLVANYSTWREEED